MRRTISSWVSTIAKLGFKKMNGRRSCRLRRRAQFSFSRLSRLEALEERQMLASDLYVVTTLLDTVDANDGVISLREAITLAAEDDSTTDNDMIQFDSALFAAGPATITLAPDQLLVDSDVTIEGPGASLLSISGNDLTRVFVVSSGVEATIRGLTITGGKVTGSADGGGIFNFGDLTLDSVHITDNETERRGGGIYSYNGTVRIVDSTISDNWADTGGGITSRSYHADALIVENSAVINNHATYAAGAFITYDTGAGPRTSKIVNSTFSGNTATSNGGAITANLGVTVTIVNSTITENTSGGVGGGIRNSGSSVTLHNTIVANNAASSAYYNDWADTSAQSASSYNLIGIRGSSSLNNDTNGNLIGSTTTPLGAGLSVLGDYGGPTKTHALLVNSSAIDRGSNAAVSVGLPTDQRGFARIVYDPNAEVAGSEIPRTLPTVVIEFFLVSRIR